MLRPAEIATVDRRDDLTQCRAALREMALELSRATDEERTRIAQGLHDDLGQTLVAVQIRLADLERADSEHGTTVQEIGALVGTVIAGLRSLTFELMAPSMPEVGIEGELEFLAIRLTERCGIPCRFSSDAAPMPLNPEVAQCVLRVARELLFNISKHSQAAKASLVVARVGDRIQITASDDGVGFQPHLRAAPERMGFGLLIVRERLAEIGGEIEIDSGPGLGTRVVVTAPLLDTA